MPTGGAPIVEPSRAAGALAQFKPFAEVHAERAASIERKRKGQVRPAASILPQDLAKRERHHPDQPRNGEPGGEIGQKTGDNAHGDSEAHVHGPEARPGLCI